MKFKEFYKLDEGYAADILSLGKWRNLGIYPTEEEAKEKIESFKKQFPNTEIKKVSISKIKDPIMKKKNESQDYKLDENEELNEGVTIIDRIKMRMNIYRQQMEKLDDEYDRMHDDNGKIIPGHETDAKANREKARKLHKLLNKKGE